MKSIFLTKGQATLVDDDDYEIYSKFKWLGCLTGKSGNYYVLRTENGRSVYLHRLIVGAEKGEVVDHINHNTLDNQKHNLRLVSYSRNALNAKDHDQKGVTLLSNGTYRAQLSIRGSHYNRVFKTLEEARDFYLKKKMEIAGV